MNLLLETHVLIWVFSRNPNLSGAATDAIRNGNNLVFVSAATAWEIAIKKSLGKLKVPGNYLEGLMHYQSFGRIRGQARVRFGQRRPQTVPLFE
jgi:PIN domain nuclease of toxin-antitoxin system